MATELQLAAIVVAAGAAALALVLEERRPRATFMLIALLGAAGGLATLVADSLHVGAALAGAAAGAGLVVVGALVMAFKRWPHAIALVTVAVIPFRVPIAYGDETANLLVPLYLAIAAGCLAYAAGYLPHREQRDRWAVRLERALAVVLVLYAVQAVYSADVELAVKNVCFFYVPFALLFRLLAEVSWTGALLLRCFAITVGLALVFAAIGYLEYATGHLLIANEKVLSANELKPYFRVNSLFFDPNIYGRFLGLTMVGLAAGLLWRAQGRGLVVTGLALAVLWGGLVLSLSQSSFAALVVGLAVLAALRWRPGFTLAAGAAAVAGAVAVVALAPASIGLATDSDRALNRATSGRVNLMEGALEMARDRPLWGYGSGGFADEYRERKKLRSQRALAESHNIPLTVAAEQGAVGLIAYLVLLAVAFAAALTGVRRAVSERPDLLAVGAAAVGAAFCALIVHTFIYAAFLEDPMTWLLLALAAALGATRRGEEPVRA